MKVAAAEGHGEAVEKMLNDDVFNRTDDYLPPIDLPKRTKGVIAKEDWGGRGYPTPSEPCETNAS